ncbi:MAG: hypothetical protein FJ271_28105 [Planctomycetes bacterium]|nr:hypothetical protein [Planctomycetota bacterium]
MQRRIAWLAPLAALVLSLGFGLAGCEDQKPVSGIAKRTLWTSSKVKGSPEPPAPYRAEVAFPKMTFSEPLDLVQAPGTDRMIVAERRGKIYSFRNQPKAEKELLLDLKTTIYAIECHPKFADNGQLFVTYIVEPDKELPTGTHIGRFTVKLGDTWTSDKKSEKLILEWPSGGHNGGCLKFGPDGFLYIGTGDGSGIADELHTGQDLSDLLGAMLRIDVDNPPAGKAYGIPKDNPFVNMKNARPENYAYGLRQPWRFSFDKKTGDLWAGEVGQDLWEMILKIERGGNYGWSVLEGTHPFRPERKRGPTPILPPVIEHSHVDFRSITGGYVYHGKRLKELHGAYIYGDFDTGRVWALRHDGKKVISNKELVDTPLRIICFAEDAAGELFFVDFIGGKIHRLVPAPKVVRTNDFPRKLSDTGLFASTKEHKPAPGLIPYSVNSQLWGDHALKERFLALPGKSQIEFDVLTYPQPSPGAPPGWRFPDGTVLVKTFYLEMERGNPATKRRLETRILHFEQLEGTQEIGDQYWQGYTYVWNDDQTDAELIGPGSLDRDFEIRDAKAPGGKVKQTWHFPSRAECTLCHTMPAKFALGVNTIQFNKVHDYNGVKANQLSTLEHLGIFTKPLATSVDKLPKLVDHEDETQPLDARARSYLHSNCSHCHMKWGGGNADFLMLYTLPLDKTGLLSLKPNHGTFGVAKAGLIVPGHPERSMVHYRMTKLGLGRMPHIASSIVDEKATKLIGDWIKGMK